MEPYAPPHGYGHRWARPRNHHAASPGRSLPPAQHLRAEEHGHLLSQDVSARDWSAERRGGDFRTRGRALESVFRRPHLPCPLCPRHRGLLRVWLHSAGDVYRSAGVVRRMVRSLLRGHAAHWARRGRPRSSVEFAHRLHESDLPVPLLEHELSRRAPYLSDRALSCPAKAARSDQGRLPDALSKLNRGLSRDHPNRSSPAEGADLFRAARAAAVGPPRGDREPSGQG